MNRQFKFQAKSKRRQMWLEGVLQMRRELGEIIYSLYSLEHDVDIEIESKTLCKLITKIGDKEIYEYNCYIDVENKPHIFTYFFYNKLGILEVRSYNLSRDNNKEDIGSINYALREQLESLLEMTFVGNLKDGIEYIREQISKSLEVKCQ